MQGARYARRPPAPHWEGTPSNHTTPSSLNNSSSSVYYLANYQGARMCESTAEDWLDLSGFAEIYHSCRPADATNTSNLSLTSWISYSLPVDSSHSRFVLLFSWISFILAIDFFCSCTCLFLLTVPNTSLASSPCPPPPPPPRLHLSLGYDGVPVDEMEGMGIGSHPGSTYGQVRIPPRTSHITHPTTRLSPLTTHLTPRLIRQLASHLTTCLSPHPSPHLTPDLTPGQVQDLPMEGDFMGDQDMPQPPQDNNQVNKF